MRRVISAMAVSISFLCLSAGVALAAPPSNDAYDDAITIGSIPFTATVDTTEATTDAVDAEINAQCGAPATDASVWYDFTAATDTRVLVDTAGSSYSAGVAVATGSPGSFEVVTCGVVAVFEAQAGVTYSILVFDYQGDGGGNGGTLQLAVSEAPPPPEIDITVDPVGSFDPKTGSAIISGTVTCSADADAFIDIQLTQRVGRFLVRGFGFAALLCDGTAQPWSVEVTGDNGLFKGGKAVAVTFGLACIASECGADVEEVTVRLRR